MGLSRLLFKVDCLFFVKIYLNKDYAELIEHLSFCHWRGSRNRVTLPPNSCRSYASIFRQLGATIADQITLLYKVVSAFCLKLKISLTTEPIGFSILGKLHIGSLMVYFSLPL